MKPSFEPILLCRKPFKGTVAANVLKYGTGALNIDGCRVPHGDGVDMAAVQRQKSNPVSGFNMAASKHGQDVPMYKPGGRWPANLIHDGSEEVVGLFPESVSNGGRSGHTAAYSGGYKREFYGDKKPGLGDSGSAARFFYCAKASRKERGEGNKHPTVKPLALMRYLVRLVSPPENGIILDPFGGSGTTAEACIREECECIVIEREPEYIDDITARVNKPEFDRRRLF